MKRLIAILLILAQPALAQAIVITDFSVNIGTASVNCVPADSSRKTLSIENPTGNTVNVGYCYGAPCTAAIGTAGTSVLAAGTLDFWPAGSAPGGAMNCIAGGSSTPVNVRVGH